MPMGSDILIYPKKSKAVEWITKFTIARSDLILGDAKSIKEEITSLTQYDEERISILCSGIDLNVFNPQVESDVKSRLGWEDNIVVICTRNHKNVYGIEYLLDAIPDVIQNCQSVRFLVVGVGPLTEEFKRLARERQIENYVLFTGYVPNTELPEYLVASDIYVSPSLSDGTSVSLLEAMGCGLPTIVTDVPANKEWIVNGENGCVVPTRDSKTLSESIISLSHNIENRKIFGRKNYEIVQRHANLENNTENLHNIYNELVRRVSAVSSGSCSE
jgi:glycosyltransferase involved in cell wall biosynthesis